MAPNRPAWRLCAAALLAAAVLAPALKAAAQPRPQQELPLEPVAPAHGAHDARIERDLAQLRVDAQGAVGAARNSPRAVRAREAAWTLGLLSLQGIGMPVDAAQAQAWFQQAERLGHPLASAGLAVCALEGCAGPPDAGAAFRHIDALARTDRGRALYLEWLAKATPASGQPPVAAGAPASAALEDSPNRDLLLRAARAGSLHAQSELALEHAAEGRSAEALRLFRPLAERSPVAAQNLVVLQRRVQTAPPTRAEELWRRAQRAHRGEGVPVNYAEALRLYEQAAAAGHAEARQMLRLIFSRRPAEGDVDIAWMNQLAHVDISASGGVSVQAPHAHTGLQREPSPLSDLVPRNWRGR